MSGWFRVYGELVDDPKFIKLSPELRSVLLMTWCIASSNDGRLLPLEDMAIKFRMSIEKTKKLLDKLRDFNWIDDNETGSEPHNWNGRQFKSDVSTERVKRFRKRRATVTETPPDTDTDTDTDTENKDYAAANAAAPASKYAFETGVIRVTRKQLDLWRQAFPNLNVEGELVGMAQYAGQQQDWFHAVAGALAKKDRLALQKSRAPPLPPSERPTLDPRL